MTSGLNEEEIIFDKNIPETQIQLDPCKAHSLTVEYKFVLRVESLRKNIEINEDGFYCNKQKRKEREMKERQRANKERIEKERIEKERIEKERIEKERLQKERIEKETQTTTPTSTPILTPHAVGGKGEDYERPAIVEAKSKNNKTAQIGLIAGVAALVVLSLTVAIVSLICWQKNVKRSNGEVALNEENRVYGSYYARSRNGDNGNFDGEGDKVYVTDNNS